jgi:rRNA-processing protein FCF1
MILIDTNSLIVLILGLMDPKLIGKHKRTSIYDEEDYYNLISIVSDLKILVVLPNVWTEVDNLLNGFGGEYKNAYVSTLSETIKKTSEEYLESIKATESYAFYDLGLTDSLILEQAKNCDLLITSDSRLSDYANSMGVPVYDIVKEINKRL